jgi:hypothetical protein
LLLHTGTTAHRSPLSPAVGAILRAWARSVSGNTTEGIEWIEDGIRNYRATGAMLAIAFLSGTKG